MRLEDKLQIMKCEEYQCKKDKPVISAASDEFYLYDLISLSKTELKRTSHMFYRVLNPTTPKIKNHISTYNIKESIELLSKHKRKAKINEKTKILINKILRDLMVMNQEGA